MNDHACRDVPVHLVAGEHDGVIAASNIRCHYAAMKAAGMDVSYREVRRAGLGQQTARQTPNLTNAALPFSLVGAQLCSRS